MKKILSKRELRKKETAAKHKEVRRIDRLHNLEIKNKYKEFVKKIKERDNRICQICGKDLKNDAPQNCQILHVLSQENYPQLKCDEMNVLTSCYRCHNVAKISSHLDGFAFVEFFKNKFPDRYEYLLNKLKEINSRI